jgi:alpha-tubulin suppressor-like RCC1 family protein
MTRPTNQGQAGSGWRVAGRAAARTAATAIAATIVFPAIGAGSTAASAAAAGTAAASAAAHRAGRAAAVGGSLRAWGMNSFGQLGDGTTTNSDTPVKVQLPAGIRVTSMRAGCGHTLALTTAGHVLAWGYNGDGELGDNTTTNSLTPVKVKLPPGTKVKAIRAGCRHSLALTTKGHVLAWGFGGDGELGIGSTLSAPEPVRVTLPKGTKVKGISAGAGHSLAFTGTGRLYAWGFNGDGELGDGTTTNRDTPVRVKLPKRTKVTLTAAGLGHSLARTSTGKVLAWGDNTDGDLGNGTTTGSLTAVRVKLPRHTKLRGLFGGCGQSLARTAKGHVLAWGDNSLGELGNGTTTNSDTPVRVKLPTGTKVTAVAAGCGHNLALTAKGHVLAWGDNQVGELGNGTTTNSNLPVRAEIPAGLVAIAVAAGPEAGHSLAIVRKAKR